MASLYLPTPVLLAPAAYQRLMHPEGELASVQGANRHGVPFVLSSNGTVSMEEITAVPGARCWFQIYIQGDRGFTRDSIVRVEAAGCEAVCVTVETATWNGRLQPPSGHAPPRVGLFNRAPPTSPKFTPAIENAA